MWLYANESAKESQKAVLYNINPLNKNLIYQKLSKNIYQKLFTFKISLFIDFTILLIFDEFKYVLLNLLLSCWRNPTRLNISGCAILIVIVSWKNAPIYLSAITPGLKIQGKNGKIYLEYINRMKDWINQLIFENPFVCKL